MLALGIWAQKITESNLIGIIMSQVQTENIFVINSFHIKYQCPEMVAPHGSYEPIFGTNPIAVGIPSSPHPVVCIILYNE